MMKIKHKDSDRLASDKSFIPFHFDVAEHSLPLGQFIDTANSTQAIIDNFNKEFFDGKLKYQIRVLAPEPGGLIEILQVIVPVAAPVWAFLGTDIGKAYIKGLTGQEPIYWAEVAGDKTKSLLVSAKAKATSPQAKKLASIILAMIVLGFVQKETGDLQKLGLSKDKFRHAYIARNRIYKACIDNEEVKGIGFDTSHDFTFQRKDFPRLMVDIPPDEEEEDEETHEWVVDTSDILVNSPNWKRDGRKWQAETSKFKDIAFSIEDENFWHHVKVKDIHPDINDNMKVQWAYRAGVVKPSSVKVLRVLNYNGKPISEPCTQAELADELQVYSVKEKEHPDLFDTFEQNNIPVEQERAHVRLTIGRAD